MKKIFLLGIVGILILFSSSEKIFAASITDYPNVAVLPFKNKAAVSTKISLQDASLVSDFVIEQLIDAHRFKIIERESLDEIVKELNYNASGLIDPETAIQIEKQKGVQFLVAGSIAGLSTKNSGLSISDSKLAGLNMNKLAVVANITARFINVETGEVVLAASGTGESARTNAELSINKKYYEDYETTSEEDADNPDVTEETEEHSRETKIKIGSDEFSQVQVRNALYKAVGDLIFNKNFGIVAKLDGKEKRRKV